MSLPQFDVQGSLFESLGAIAPDLFKENDKYKLFARKVWPVLARCRQELAECYQTDNGRPGIEPVVLLGELIFQFLERVPDRQAVELVKYHLGWKLALNLKLSEEGFPPTTLVYFRQRLIEHAKSATRLRCASSSRCFRASASACLRSVTSTNAPIRRRSFDPNWVRPREAIHRALPSVQTTRNSSMNSSPVRSASSTEFCTCSRSSGWIALKRFLQLSASPATNPNNCLALSVSHICFVVWSIAQRPAPAEVVARFSRSSLSRRNASTCRRRRSCASSTAISSPSIRAAEITPRIS